MTLPIGTPEIESLTYTPWPHRKPPRLYSPSPAPLYWWSCMPQLSPGQKTVHQYPMISTTYSLRPYLIVTQGHIKVFWLWLVLIMANINANSKGSAAGTGYTITAVGMSPSESTPCKLQCMMQQHSIYLHNHWYNLFVRMWYEWIYCWIFFGTFLQLFKLQSYILPWIFDCGVIELDIASQL